MDHWRTGGLSLEDLGGHEVDGLREGGQFAPGRVADSLQAVMIIRQSLGIAAVLGFIGFSFFQVRYSVQSQTNMGKVSSTMGDWLRRITYQCVKIQGALRAKLKFPFLVPTLILLRMDRITRQNGLIET